MLSHLKRSDMRGQTSHIYNLPYVRSSIIKKSVVHRSVIVWNALPVTSKNVNDFSMFKNLLFTYYLKHNE